MDARRLADLGLLVEALTAPVWDPPEDPWPPIVEIISIERTQEADQ